MLSSIVIRDVVVGRTFVQLNARRLMPSLRSRIVIDAMFLYGSLHVSIVKLFSHISLQVFRMSATLSNYLDDSVSRLASTFTLERYGPRVFAQHVNDDENVIVTFVET